jgi:hypothetical protein
MAALVVTLAPFVNTGFVMAQSRFQVAEWLV